MHKRNMFLLVISRVVACLIALTMLSGSTVSVFAAGQKERTNETTGYKAVIADEAELLTDSEETRLIEDMMPITRYANIAVYTVDTATRLQDYERARDKRAELFGSDNAAVFMIDMYLRRIVIQRKGNMESYFNNASANNITSNVAHLATEKKYYDVCRTAMLQMFDVIEDRNVPRPMQYICNACIAVMLALLFSFVVAVITSTTYIRPKAKIVSAGVALAFGKDIFLRTDSKYTPSSGGSSGSGCGSGCGSSCGSSCGGSSF